MKIHKILFIVFLLFFSVKVQGEPSFETCGATCNPLISDVRIVRDVDSVIPTPLNFDRGDKIRIHVKAEDSGGIKYVRAVIKDNSNNSLIYIPLYDDGDLSHGDNNLLNGSIGAGDGVYSGVWIIPFSLETSINYYLHIEAADNFDHVYRSLDDIIQNPNDYELIFELDDVCLSSCEAIGEQQCFGNSIRDCVQNVSENCREWVENINCGISECCDLGAGFVCCPGSQSCSLAGTCIDCDKTCNNICSNPACSASQDPDCLPNGLGLGGACCGNTTCEAENGENHVSCSSDCPDITGPSIVIPDGVILPNNVSEMDTILFQVDIQDDYSSVALSPQISITGPNNTSLHLADDGSGGDIVAGDHIFSVIIDTSLWPLGSYVVDVQASDSLGNLTVINNIYSFILGCVDSCIITGDNVCSANNIQICAIDTITGCSVWQVVSDCQSAGQVCYTSPGGAYCDGEDNVAPTVSFISPFESSNNWSQQNQIDFDTRGVKSDTLVTNEKVTLDFLHKKSVVQISSGALHACAVVDTGEVYCWGKNTTGQLGNATTVDSSTPVRVVNGAFLSNIKSVDVGKDFSCALSNMGIVYCWGNNQYGQLGKKSTASQGIAPESVSKGESTSEDNDGFKLINIKSISVGGQHACAISNSGNIYCWGYNIDGQLGNGTFIQSNAPVRVLKGDSISGDNDGTYLNNIKLINGGDNHTCVVSNNDSTYCWGNNQYGQLGNGLTSNQNRPVHVLRGDATPEDNDGIYLNNVKVISGGNEHTCAVSNSDIVYCWGHNVNGQLGDGTNQDKNSPVVILALPLPLPSGVEDSNGITLANVKSISSGQNQTCAVINNGNTYCWGNGYLGDGASRTWYTPVRVQKGVSIELDNDGTNLTNIKNVNVGDNYTCVNSNSGNAYCWGNGSVGQLGDGELINEFFPTKVKNIGVNNFIAQVVSGHQHNCALSVTGEVYCWGGNNYGQLGDGTSVQKAFPVRVRKGNALVEDNDGIYLTNIKSISAGFEYTCALSNIGNIYCWGYNANGQLGDNTTTNSDIPSRVLSGASTGDDNDGTYLNNIKFINAGHFSTCAVSRSNNTYCWGKNTYGQLGDNTTVDKHTPTRVVRGNAMNGDNDGTYLTNIFSIEADYYHACAVANSGYMYCWGSNVFGQLGDSTQIQRLVPTLVLDGNAMSGDSDGVYLNNVKNMSVKDSYTCAVSNGGNIYCWGRNQHGQLGDGFTSSGNYIPGPVVDGDATGSDTNGTNLINIQSVNTGNNHACAVSNSGNIYCWGYGAYGRLGNGTTNDSLAPFRVLKGGAKNEDISDNTYLSNIKTVSAGQSHTCVNTEHFVYCWGYNSAGQLGDETFVNKNLAEEVHGENGVDLLHLSRLYNLAGTYEAMYDTIDNRSFGAMSWTWSDRSLSIGAIIDLRVRSCDDAFCSGEQLFSSCPTLTSFGEDISANSCVTDGDRFIQYQAFFSSREGVRSSSLDSVSIDFTQLPFFDVGDSFNIRVQITDTSPLSVVNLPVVNIQHPDGVNISSLILYDDGAHGDGLAGDNEYGTLAWDSTGQNIGVYQLDVIVEDNKGNISNMDNIGDFYLE